jgi:hypothetical protein
MMEPDFGAAFENEPEVVDVKNPIDFVMPPNSKFFDDATEELKSNFKKVEL